MSHGVDGLMDWFRAMLVHSLYGVPYHGWAMQEIGYPSLTGDHILKFNNQPSTAALVTGRGGAELPGASTAELRLTPIAESLWFAFYSICWQHFRTFFQQRGMEDQFHLFATAGSISREIPHDRFSSLHAQLFKAGNEASNSDR